MELWEEDPKDDMLDGEEELLRLHCAGSGSQLLINQPFVKRHGPRTLHSAASQTPGPTPQLAQSVHSPADGWKELDEPPEEALPGGQLFGSAMQE